MELNPDIFQSIIEASPFPVYMCTGEEKIVAVANDATLNAWGKDRSVIGKRFDDALPELRDQPFSRLISQVYQTGEPFNTSNYRADMLIDGRTQAFYFKFTLQAMRDGQGKIFGVVCFSTDVTELERAREAVEKSQMILSNMIRQAPLGICIIRADDLRVEIVNDAYLELVGKERTEIEGRRIWDGIPEAKEFYGPILDEAIRSGMPYYALEHLLKLTRKGVEETVYFDFVYEPIRDTGGSISTIMVVAIEVTEKVITLHRIEEAEERARLAIEAAEIGTFDLDLLTGNILTSERLNAIFGFDPSAPRKTLTDAIHPDDKYLRIAAHEEALTTGRLFYEVRIIRDGLTGWIRAQGKVYYDANDTPVRILGTLLDITEFKRLQQQKDDFISVASHELKTPMTSLKASMQLLDKLINSDASSDKIPVFIRRANASLMKMQQLVDSLLNVSKSAAGQLALQKTRFRMADLISECCEQIRLTGSYDLQLSGDTGIEVHADRNRIDQVIVNLLNNAVKYASGSGKILICLERLEGTIKVSVQDFGIGIPAEKLHHLFERYYRVDSSGVQYSGLGLGLYITADIIGRHGGRIGVESKEGEGSTFWFTLPD